MIECSNTTYFQLLLELYIFSTNIESHFVHHLKTAVIMHSYNITLEMFHVSCVNAFKNQILLQGGERFFVVN